MNDYKDLSELLESDSRAMRFYNSLPLSLQQKMHRGGGGAVAELYSAAGGGIPKHRKTLDPAASANECTGLIAAGGELGEDEWAKYNNLEIFGTGENNSLN